jgi:hypothetical protein
MPVYAAAARLRLASLVAGDEKERMREGTRTMSERGIVAPERFTAMLIPGSWA